MHDECQQDERIRSLTSRIDKMEVNMINSVDFQRKVIWGMVGILFTTVGTLITILMKVKGVG
jgi:hypothetical protein